MDEKVPHHQEPPGMPAEISISSKEWTEIEDSVIALGAVLRKLESGGDEEEVLKAVLMRQEAALRPIRARIDPNLP